MRVWPAVINGFDTEFCVSQRENLWLYAVAGTQGRQFYGQTIYIPAIYYGTVVITYM